MKVRNKVFIGLLATNLFVSSSTVCGAKLMNGRSQKSAASTVNTPSSPELTVADQKVTKAKEQLETAKKQLTAAKALLHAAEADFKAAKSARAALALQLQANNLADASGLKQLTAQQRLTPVTANEPMTAPANASIESTNPKIAPSAEPVQNDFSFESLPTEDLQKSGNAAK